MWLHSLSAHLVRQDLRLLGFYIWVPEQTVGPQSLSYLEMLKHVTSWRGDLHVEHAERLL